MKRLLVLGILVIFHVLVNSQTTAPTAPTDVPTLPTAIPTAPTPPTTQKPTTKSPTQKPTVPTKSPSFRPTVSPAAVIYLYSNNVWEVDGDLGSRAETSWYCENIAVTLNLFCSSHAAFLSYSTSDSLLNIPANHLGASATAIAVKSASGTTLATSWNNLFSYPKSIDFITGGVLPVDSQGYDLVYYTGSNSDGTFKDNASTCNAWTSNAAFDIQSSLGQAVSLDGGSIDYGLGDCVGTQLNGATAPARVLCACFYTGI